MLLFLVPQQLGIGGSLILSDWKTLAKTPTEWTNIKHNDPRLDAFASEVEKRYELPKGVIVSLKNAGERTDPGKVSPAGAKGIMQFTDSTLKLREGAFAHDVNNPFASIDASGKYMKELIKENRGNVLAAVANYNGGPSQAKLVRMGKKPTAKETREYVARIQDFMKQQNKKGNT